MDTLADDAPAAPALPWKVSWVPRVRRVVAAIDFSPSGRALAKAAVALVEQHWLAKLTLVHVVPPAPWLEGSAQERLGAGKKLMGDLLDTLDPESRPDARVVEGQPAPEICRVADKLDADLIMLASHGRTGLHRALWGSIAEAVVHKAGCSVLVFKPMVPFGNQIGQVPARTRRVAVAFDGSAGAKAALSAALQFARHGAEQLTLIRAVEPSSIIVAPYSDPWEGNRQMELAREELANAAKALDPALDVKTNVQLGDAWRVITEAVVQLNADLLVMGVQKRWQLGGSLLGSTCERTVRHAVCPVLIVKPAAVH